MLRKLTALFVACILLLSVPAALADDLLATVLNRGKLTIATEGEWAPWTYHDETDALVGFDVEVAQAIAGQLGVEADFVEGPWSGILQGVDNGMYDIAANGVEITDNLTPIISNWDGGEPLHFTVKRGDEEIGLSLTPDYIATEKRYMIGVTLTVGAETIWRHDGVGATLGHTWDVCLDAGGSIMSALKNLVTRGEGINEMSGPVGVISIIAEQTRAYRLMGYLNILIVISINLGLVNLLPIPGLDGCRILFVLFEIIFRRPVNRRVEAYIHLAGYAFLMCVMLYFTFHDVLNIFG